MQSCKSSSSCEEGTTDESSRHHVTIMETGVHHLEIARYMGCVARLAGINRLLVYCLFVIVIGSSLVIVFPYRIGKRLGWSQDGYTLCVNCFGAGRLS